MMIYFQFNFSPISSSISRQKTRSGRAGIGSAVGRGVGTGVHVAAHVDASNPGGQPVHIDEPASEYVLTAQHEHASAP